MVIISYKNNYQHRVLLVKQSWTFRLKIWPQIRLGRKEKKKWGNQKRQLAI